MPEPHTSRQVEPCPWPFYRVAAARDKQNIYICTYSSSVCWRPVGNCSLSYSKALRQAQTPLEGEGHHPETRGREKRLALIFTNTTRFFIHFYPFHSLFHWMFGGYSFDIHCFQWEHQFSFDLLFSTGVFAKKNFKIGLDQIILHKSFSTSCS